MEENFWGNELEKLSQNRKWSVSQTARELEINRSYLDDVTKGRRDASPLLKAKIWDKIGGNFNDFEFLIDLLDDKTKEFVIKKINTSEEKIIKDLKKAKDDDDYKEMIQLLAKHRNWTTEELAKDLKISNEEMESILEGDEIPKWVDKIKIKDRVLYDVSNFTIINKLPEIIGKKLHQLNKWNMKRLAETAKKKIAKDGDQ